MFIAGVSDAFRKVVSSVGNKTNSDLCLGNLGAERYRNLENSKKNI